MSSHPLSQLPGRLNSLVHFTGDPRRLMSDIAQASLGRSMRRTPYKTRTLARSETARVDISGKKAWLGSALVYAPYVHEGTGPYTIRPLHKRFLAWKGVDGKWHYARSVRHPGLKPRPYFRWGIEDAAPQFPALARKWATENFNKAMK